MGLILNEDGDLTEPGVQTIAQSEIDDTVFAPEGNRRLCTLVGEGKEPFTFSTSQDHGENILHGPNSSRTVMK